MSMLSAQCDELRELATKYDELQVGAVRAVRIPLDTGSVLREAADTIWQLRDDLQRANVENAKLREDLEDQEGYDQMLRDRLRQQTELCVKAEAENAKLRNEVDNLLDFEHLTSVAVAYAGCDECGEYKQTMLRLFADNAKLRELVRGLYKAFMHSNCYRWCGFKEPCNHILDCKCQWYNRMRKLGVEVDDAG